MKIAVLNKSTCFTDLTGPALDRICDALNRQIKEDYAPMWQGGEVEVFATDSPEGLDQDVCPLLVMDSPDQTGALGYHSTFQGRPFSKVFAGPIKQAGGTLFSDPSSLSVTLSHEVLETIQDPYANFWVDVDANTQEALEIADRVQGDGYQIDSIFVSDFLGPRAFSHGAGPYDFMNLLKSPFEIRSTGYAIRRVAGVVHNIFGHRRKAWMNHVGSRKHARGL